MRTSDHASRSTWGKRLRSTALAAVTTGALLAMASPAAAQSKVAVVDVRRAVLETEQGLRVQATLKKLFDARQVELDAKQRQLQADKESLEKEAQSPKANKESIAKKYDTLQRQAAELQTTMVEYQREMQRKETEMTTPILTGVLEAVKRIASQEGYEVVVEKSAAPFFRGDLELTDRAIQLFNSGSPAPKAPTPAPGATPPAKGGAPAPAAPPAKAPAPKAEPKK